MTSSEPALAAYQRSLSAYHSAARTAAVTGDPRHWKHARILRDIVREKRVIYEAEFVLQQIEGRERRNAELMGRRLPP